MGRGREDSAVITMIASCSVGFRGSLTLRTDPTYLPSVIFVFDVALSLRCVTNQARKGSRGARYKDAKAHKGRY